MAKSKCKVTYDPHAIALEFPRMSAQEQQELNDDIGANGLLVPIVLHEEMILDGVGRSIGCEASGVEPRYVQYDGESPEDFVASMNAHRRQITKEQKLASLTALAMRKTARLNLARHFGEQDHSRNTGKNADSWGGSNAVISHDDVKQIAESVGVGERSVERMAKVLDASSSEVIKAVKAGDVSVSDAAAVADLPKREQSAALKAVEQESANTLTEAAIIAKLDRAVADAFKGKEFTLATAKKLAALPKLDQVLELKSIRAKAGRKAASNAPSTQVVSGHKSESGPKPPPNEKPKGAWAPYHKLLGKLVRTVDECASASGIATDGPRVKEIHAAFNVAHKLVLAMERGR